MAAIGVALWKYVMRYAPHTPEYFNRDRFVLSNGEYARSPSGVNRQLTADRPYMSLPVLVPSPYRLQGNEPGAVEVISL